MIYETKKFGFTMLVVAELWELQPKMICDYLGGELERGITEAGLKLIPGTARFRAEQEVWPARHENWWQRIVRVIRRKPKPRDQLMYRVAAIALANAIGRRA